MPATFAPWSSGIMISNIPPNMTKATVSISNQANVPADTGWLVIVWQQRADLNWYPMTSIGDSGIITPGASGSVTFNIPPGPIGIQVCGFTMPADGTGPGAVSAYFATTGPVTNGTATLSGYNFGAPPPSGWGISQLNPTTSISVSVVLSGGGGM